MKRKYIILLHIVFWLLFLVNDISNSISRGYLTGYKSVPVDFHLFIRYALIAIGYILLPLISFYCAYILVAAQVIIKKNYGKAVLFTILTFAIIVACRYVLEYYFFLPVLGFDNYKGHSWPVNRYLVNIFLVYFPGYFLYGLMLFFITDWYKTRHLRQELEKEKAAAELTFLRSQLNPHFLFNSINDIYSLAYQQSEQAPAALLKLSEILRYMLREGHDDTMSIQSEIKYIENVIELQRISTRNAVCIQFNIEGYIGTQKIATLLLIAFVENAFKHGVLTDPENPVVIGLVAMHQKINFTMHNKKNRDQKDKTAGIGLNNVRRRLELIYPDKHKLTITNQPDSFTVNLELQLI